MDYNEFGDAVDEQVNIAKDTSTRFHPELDFDRMRASFEELFEFHEKSLEHDPPEDREDFYASMLSDRTQELAMVDRLEARQHPKLDYVATDVFMMQYGEPPERSMTKVGGVPYWPADRPWPTNWREKPLRFLAQVNFTDSRDLFDALPNDVLLMFEGSLSQKEVWLPAGLTDLIDPDDVPKTKRHVFQSYGVIRRLYDPPAGGKPECSPLCEQAKECIKIGGNPWAKKVRFPSGGPLLFQLHGFDEIGKEWEEECGADGNDECDSNSMTFCCEFYQCPPRSVFLMPNGKIRSVYDRHLDVYQIDELAEPDCTELLSVTNNKTQEVRTYGFAWRWPFIHRM